MKSKSLSSLIVNIHGAKIYGRTDIGVRAIVDDTRKIKKGYLFVAIKGLRVDSHEFIKEAIKKGAVVIVCEKVPLHSTNKDVTFVKVKNSRQALALLASNWFDNPASKLKIIGVTGTDGKTTTASLIYWILKKAGQKVGLISTVSAKIKGKDYDTGFHVTNPEPLALHSFLNKMLEAGCKIVVLEVTSHGLDQDRVFGIKFDIAVLTNITHEHIDYHGTLQNYMKSKSKLFNSAKIAILNKSDGSFKRFRPLIRTKRILLYDEFTIKGKLSEAVRRRFKEEYNLLNSAAAIIATRVLGVKDSVFPSAFRTFPQIPGRMEEIPNKKNTRIIVDFAHTPNALKKVLETLREQTKGKLIVVFGCAGERDVKKRQMMPEVSVKFADISIFTAEDPRSESVYDILKIMTNAAKKSGATENKDFFVIPERGEAIFFAVNKLAQKDDIVVLCGKGHERSMAYNGVEYPWSDQEAVKFSLKGKAKNIKWKKN